MSNKSKKAARKIMSSIYKQVAEDKKKRTAERRKATLERKRELGLPNQNEHKKPSNVIAYQLSPEELAKYKNL